MDTLATLLFLAAFAAQGPEESCRAGVKLFSEGKLGAAAATLESTVALHPKDALCWKALGVVYAAQSKFDLAETPLRKACDLNPKLEDACLYYGRVLYLRDRFDTALHVLRGALRNDKRSGRIHRIIALSLEGLGRAPEAEASFQEAIRLERDSPADEDPGIDYGVFLFRQGRSEAALSPLEAALARHPASPRAHLEWGRALLALDRAEAAVLHLEQAVALNPESSRAHLLLGKAYLRLGKTEAAAEHLRQGSRTVK